ncbi:MAG: DNA mismatch repair endonuclease MutL [Candidatus Eisenbacteria bacterium]|uniref:DNA mismatch repair protein MutL n=1 Tax=Eiseniibacteriota bacterium TaxID=2212470 RepID=A0A956SD48_UNCEI|nr:DNA mismatch repair endonuclease MutL [Candidatus Eisenbacteria bacterium]
MTRPRVQRLDPGVVSKIAAGEMILRPLSVAKELLENSLDANARRIEVELGDRPDASISVSDDGIGMTPEDLELALETHATSKLRSEEDLLRVGSLGFRGEAIPSIGRVSRMEIRTSPDDSGLGHRAVVEGGDLQAFEPCSRSRGTTVRADDLFFNSPVRKRFLKSASAEARAIKKMVEVYSLAHPGVHFRLTNRGESVLDLSPVSGLADRIVQLHGPKMLEKLLPVEERAPSYYAFGFVGVPELARAGTQHQTFLVNGRWVSAPWLVASVRQAFGDLLPPSKNPWAVMLLGLDPGRIDVNVHPTKREIRFLDESELFGWLTRIVRQQAQSLVPTWNLDRADKGGGWSRPRTVEGGGASLFGGGGDGRGEVGGRGGGRGHEGGGADVSGAYGPNTGASQARSDYRPNMGPLLDDLYRGPNIDAGSDAAGGAVAEGSALKWDEDSLPWETPSGAASGEPIRSGAGAPADAPPGSGADTSEGISSAIDARFRENTLSDADTRPAVGTERPSVLWQLHRRYILVQTETGMLIVDQHAAHERILYEKFVAQLEAGAGPTQQLLTPIPVSLEPEEMDLFERFSGDFGALGLDVSEFGKDTVLLQGVPVLWSRDPEQHFRDVLADLSDRPSRRLQERREHLAASFACRSAIKSGRPLARDEMERLIRDLFRTSVPHGDPHGRPTYIEVDLYDLDGRFGRH